MKYSFVIPVYNRPDEVDELLASLCDLPREDFEVVIVEDGSTISCEEVVKRYAERLDVHYYSKANSGPGQSRNYGVARSLGEYVLILDSDIVLPSAYLSAVKAGLETDGWDAFGGPDRAHDSFTPVQKAINYAMTSFFTTGGIRGGKKKMDKFYPRSFNMGVRREVYERLGGFSCMRFGEDIDFSIRLFNADCKVGLISDAWVWHKRRTDFRKFFKQVHNSGIARINLMKRHAGTLKLVHLLPALFTLGVVFCLVGSVFCPWAILPLVLIAAIVCVDAACRNRSVKVGLLAIVASYVQLLGYGTGFLWAWWRRCVRGKDEFEAFSRTFYK